MSNTERILKIAGGIDTINEAMKLLILRVNELEIQVDNLRVQQLHHDHPYKPEPRYGGSLYE